MTGEPSTTPFGEREGAAQRIIDVLNKYSDDDFDRWAAAREIFERVVRQIAAELERVADEMGRERLSAEKWHQRTVLGVYFAAEHLQTLANEYDLQLSGGYDKPFEDAGEDDIGPPPGPPDPPRPKNWPKPVA